LQEVAYSYQAVELQEVAYSYQEVEFQEVAYSYQAVELQEVAYSYQAVELQEFSVIIIVGVEHRNEINNSYIQEGRIVIKWQANNGIYSCYMESSRSNKSMLRFDGNVFMHPAFCYLGPQIIL
jgi:hypothetical protein